MSMPIKRAAAGRCRLGKRSTLLISAGHRLGCAASRSATVRFADICDAVLDTIGGEEVQPDRLDVRIFGPRPRAPESGPDLGEAGTGDRSARVRSAALFKAALKMPGQRGR
jgi:hypothetical protein